MTTHASITIALSPDLVLDAILDPVTMPRKFVGAGPVLGISRSEILEGGAVLPGKTRRIWNADGTVLDERILAASVAEGHRYESIAPPTGLGGLLASKIEGEWRLDSLDGRTVVQWRLTMVPRGKIADAILRLAISRHMARAMQSCLRNTERLALESASRTVQREVAIRP
jgi:hypothetical protein